MLLCFVSLVPWPTALAADYIRRGDSSASTAAFLYAAIMMLLGLSISVAWSYLDRNPELVHEAARPGLPAATKRSLIGATAYIPALAIAPVSAAASLAITAAIAVYFALSRTTVPSLLTGATDE